MGGGGALWLAPDAPRRVGRGGSALPARHARHRSLRRQRPQPSHPHLSGRSGPGHAGGRLPRVAAPPARPGLARGLHRVSGHAPQRLGFGLQRRRHLRVVRPASPRLAFPSVCASPPDPIATIPLIGCASTAITPGTVAAIDAKRAGAAEIQVKTANLDGFTLTLDRPASLVTIDGTAVRVKPAATLSFSEAAGAWKAGRTRAFRQTARSGRSHRGSRLRAPDLRLRHYRRGDRRGTCRAPPRCRNRRAVVQLPRAPQFHARWSRPTRPSPRTISTAPI